MERSIFLKKPGIGHTPSGVRGTKRIRPVSSKGIIWKAEFVCISYLGLSRAMMHRGEPGQPVQVIDRERMSTDCSPLRGVAKVCELSMGSA